MVAAESVFGCTYEFGSRVLRRTKAAAEFRHMCLRAQPRIRVCTVPYDVYVHVLVAIFALAASDTADTIVDAAAAALVLLLCCYLLLLPPTHKRAFSSFAHRMLFPRGVTQQTCFYSKANTAEFPLNPRIPTS